MAALDQFLAEENRKTREASLWRTLRTVENLSATEILVDGRKLLNFSTNDYLGYSCHPGVVGPAIEALNRYGPGGRSSRLISGNLDLHRELERKLAAFKGTEASLIFPTGFMANLGLVSSVLGEGDAILIDRLNHASLIDAARLSKCRIFVYEHGSVPSLKKVLERTEVYRKRLVATDSLFSMDGDLAPLPDLVRVCRERKVWLMIDDAHATGVLGENGVGLADHFGMMGQVDIVMGTLSKALGSQGGFICGSKELIEYLVNKSRPFIFTTALSPVNCAASIAALDLVKKEPERRRKLLNSARQVREAVKEKFPSESRLIGPDVTPIIPVHAGSAKRALRLSKALSDEGFFIPAIRPPTVPKNESRLRISVSSEHSERDVRLLLDSLSKCIERDPEES